MRLHQNESKFQNIVIFKLQIMIERVKMYFDMIHIVTNIMWHLRQLHNH